MDENKITEGCKEVATAIIARAALDYMEYKRDLYRLGFEDQTDEKVKEEINRLEVELKLLDKFFKTSIYMSLMNISSEWVIETLDKEFEKWRIEHDKLLL